MNLSEQKDIFRLRRERELKAFSAWLASAAPGERHIYFKGFLAFDRESTSENGRFIGKMGRIAMNAFDLGLVHLVQIKHGPRHYDYCAIKR